jgi:ADP-ribose pyrophosphatase YjhB (NUDIX family)
MQETLKDSKDFHNYSDKIIQQLSIDCVVFGFHQNQLKVLLLKSKHIDEWMLPGGFVLQNEDIEAAAHRILGIRTGIQDIYLELFSVFGNANRQFPEIHQASMRAWGYQPDPNHWICKRFVSIGYYALVDFSKVIPTADEFSAACDWFDITEIPNLCFDHAHIFQKALEKLRQNLDVKLVGFNLLPPTFTMGELQNLYETFLGKKLSRTNFQRKMLSLEVLERVEKKFSGGAHKAPYLYRFDEQKGEVFLEKKHF